MKLLRSLITTSFLALCLSGCAFNSNQEAPEITSSVADLNKSDHYVRVVLPEAEKSPGTVVTINMPPREPYTHQFAEDLDITNPEERLHVFNLASPLQPATMTVDYNNGESHTMSQVVFDTTIETP